LAFGTWFAFEGNVSCRETPSRCLTQTTSGLCEALPAINLNNEIDSLPPEEKDKKKERAPRNV
jgi:hypothetical protein